MQVTITPSGQDHVEEVRRLHGFLVADEDLRGRVRLAAMPPEPGTLGAADVLLAALGPGGITAALVSALIAYLRRPGPRVGVKVRRPDGATVELTAERVRGLDAAAMEAITAELTRTLDSATQPGSDDDAAS
jgi:hypothetical protein